MNPRVAESPAEPETAAPPAWSTARAEELYRLHLWGKGYVGISARGTVEVYPDKDPARSIDLHEIVLGLEERGFEPPLLIRLSDLLDHRLRELRSAFDDAIRQVEYSGQYTCVYPIKVNQQRHICEEIRDLGSELGFGLEAGSIPELLAVLALTSGHEQMPIICNGFKDHEFIEMVILATKLGRRIVPVVERFHELELIMRYARRYQVRPRIGMRVKLSAKGVGRWEHSAGVRGKFGLSVSEILRGIEKLREHDLLDCLELLHCHIGSQVFDIRSIKNAVSELAHVYCGMVKQGAPMGYLDLGGGMGVDYDGSQSASESSINYTVQEYATDVVYRVQNVCDDAGVPHPHLITESGRALTAYSSVLVCDVLGARRMDARIDLDTIQALVRSEGDEVPQPLLDLLDVYERVSSGGLVELYHDATHAREEAMTLFGLGYTSLPVRAATEELFWAIGRILLDRAGEDLPDELSDLPALLGDIYFCNFSIFQSVPDSWGIDQLFPIVPLHRLDEEPTRRGVLADLTCDSDGKIDRFVDPYEEKRTLELHELREVPSNGNGLPDTEPYYLGIFLVGAYQEILGDLHNLLGDTHAVHVRLDGDGEPVIEEIVEGDTVEEVLRYVQYDPPQMKQALRKDVERAIRDRRLTVQEGRQFLSAYDAGLEGYTYLETDDE
ncbi:MAG: biosynthetic arginine decarboxylase [Gemmatimonadota bacterium]